MVKPRIPKDNDFIKQYGGAVNQYGSAGSPPISDQSAADFQKHMQVQETQNSKVPQVSPEDLMSGQMDPNQGQPHPSFQTPAPENFGPPKVGNVDTETSAKFGPPKVGNVDTENTPQFGPPGAQGFKGVQSNMGAPKPGMTPAQGGDQSTSQNNLTTSRQEQMQAQIQNAQSSTQQSGASLGASNNQGQNLQSGGDGGGTGDSGKSDATKKKTYKEVEKTEIDNMLQNAMSHMKFKDPDPSAWG